MNALEKQVAVLFRQAELRERAKRRSRLINEASLATEQLTGEEQIINRLAVANLKAQEEAFNVRVGYWRRLWNAVLGRSV